MRRFAGMLLVLAAATAHAGGSVKVVATTTLIGDVVEHVAGGLVELRTLLPPGVDPHAFEPTPRDAALLTDANVIFANGVGLEDSYLPGLLKKSKTKAKVVEVSQGISLRDMAGGPAHEHGEHDPHVWMNPQNVKVWTQNIEQTLQALDPAHSNVLHNGSAEYQRYLDEIDRWAGKELRSVIWDQRKLVTDHDSFGYFADHYGYDIIGAVIPGSSTGAEPSAQDLAQLEDDIRQYKVKAVIVGKTVNPDLARRVAGDTGIQLVALDTCSLPRGVNYFDFMTEIVEKIVDALK